jgi:dipeptidyl aminopeptidase/acylaminoacyl peptidase
MTPTTPGAVDGSGEEPGSEVCASTGAVATRSPAVDSSRAAREARPPVWCVGMGRQTCDRPAWFRATIGTYAPEEVQSVVARASIVVLTLVLAVATAAAGQSPGPDWRATDLRPVEIEDVRLISMSPEGSLLVAARPAMGFLRGELCVYRVDTLREQACADLSLLEAGIRLEDVTWSPDGSMIAFGERTFLTFQDGDLWLMDTATGELTNLDDDGFSGTLPLLEPDPDEGLITVPVSPTFTPDGSAVTFSRSLVVDGQGSGNEIATVPVTGGEPERLLLVDAEQLGVVYAGIRWAPAGDVLFYSYHPYDLDDPRAGVWSVNADGSANHQVTGAADPESGGPAVLQVSAEGDRLLAYYPRVIRSRGPKDAYALVDLATGTEERLVAPHASERPVEFVTLASLSPDGTGVLEVIRGSDPDNQVLVRDVVTGELTSVVPEGLAVAGPIEYGLIPTWAPDGRVFITGAGALSQGTLLTIEKG